MNEIKQVEKMLAVGTPIVIVETQDHPHTRVELITAMKLKGESNGGERPLIGWNAAASLFALNERGKEALKAMSPASIKAAAQGVHVALTVTLDFPDGTIFIVDNLHWWWTQPAVMQAVQNVREPFKSSKRALIALTTGGSIPLDLQQDVSFVRIPLPDETVLASKIKEVSESVTGKPVADDEAVEIGRELRGSSPFKAEQLAFQSVTKSGIDRTRLRGNASKTINDTVGLSVESAKVTFEDVGGLFGMRKFLDKFFAGPRRPVVVVRIEEIEKALSGYDTDSSGVSGDILGALLTAMEDYGWTGIFAYGVSGCGKSLIAKAAAGTYGCRGIRFDINACKGSLVGQSGEQVRQALDVMFALGGARVFFIASMNKIASLPPELRRRFAAGTWYFDVPSKKGRENIWEIEAKHFDVEWDGYDSDGLTGSDIRDIVSRSWELGCTTTEAANYHVPLCRSAPDAIESARADADGRYLDADKGGTYSRSVSRGEGDKRSVEL